MRPPSELPHTDHCLPEPLERKADDTERDIQVDRPQHTMTLHKLVEKKKTVAIRKHPDFHAVRAQRSEVNVKAGHAHTHSPAAASASTGRPGAGCDIILPIAIRQARGYRAVLHGVHGNGRHGTGTNDGLFFLQIAVQSARRQSRREVYNKPHPSPIVFSVLTLPSHCCQIDFQTLFCCTRHIVIKTCTAPCVSLAIKVSTLVSSSVVASAV